MKTVSRLFALIGVLFLLFLVIGPSHAQFSALDPSMNPITMMRDMQSGALPLLSRQEVQKELKLTKSQSEQIKKIQKEQETLLKEQSKSAQGGDTTQMIESLKKMRAAQAELNSRAKALLTDEQRQRLGEIRLQTMGLQAVSDPETQTALGMTPEQKTSLSALGDEYMMAKMNATRDIKSAKKKQEALEKEFAEKVSKTLTADQNALLKKMEGAPFKDLKQIKMF